MTKLDELVKCISSGHVYIQTHNFPDPDAIGSGYGLQYLLETRGIKSTICYGGAVDRYSTQKMIELFGIDIVNMQELGAIGESGEIILVDTQNEYGNIEASNGTIIACIDHHMISGVIDYKFSDIREKVGACASIVASYFYENDIEVPKDIAEVLMYGINIDTANLTRSVSQSDMDMFYNLYGVAGNERISYLENNTIQVEDLEAYVQAISSIRIRENVCFANAGRNCTKSLVAAISDFTGKIAGVSVSVVYTIRENGIRLSVRSSGKELHSGQIMVESLGNMGNCGGHSAMAGGFVPYSTDVGMSAEELIKTIEERTLLAIRKCRQ